MAELESQLKSFAQGVKISIPTNTMEQEFHRHYCKGLAAGKAERDRLQSELTQEIEDSKEIQKVRDTYSAECVRLQSECKALRKLLGDEAIKSIQEQAK